MTSPSYAYTVVGAAKCGGILSLHNDDNPLNEYAVFSWTNGYITGRNYELNKSMTNKVPDTDSLYYAVIKFCRENPLKDIDDAAVYIYSTLR